MGIWIHLLNLFCWLILKKTKSRQDNRIQRIMASQRSSCTAEAGFGQLLKLVTKGDVKPTGNPPWALPEHLHHFTKKNGLKYFNDQNWSVEALKGDCFHVPLRRSLKLNRLPIWLSALFPAWSESLVFILKKKEEKKK